MISILYVAAIFVLLKKSNFFEFEGIKKIDIYNAFLIHLVAGIVLYIIYTEYYQERYTSDIFKFYDDSLVLYNLFFDAHTELWL